MSSLLAADLHAVMPGVRADLERLVRIPSIAFEGAGRAVYVDDPDGNVVELWTWDVAEHLR